MSDGHPLFAFVFVGRLGRAVDDFAEADAASGSADFVWVHLDLSDAASQAWLRRLCVPIMPSERSADGDRRAR